MHQPTRMSPLTALFGGMFFVGGVAIASGATVVLYGMKIIDSKASSVIHFAGNTIDGLPDLLRALPPAIGDLLNDRRAPEYAANIKIDAKMVADESGNVIRPVLTVRNEGTEMVSMLALRVAALDAKGVPVGDWTEVVATPIAVDDDWRGPLMPGATRYVRMNGRRVSAESVAQITPVTEISDVRVWQSAEKVARN